MECLLSMRKQYRFWVTDENLKEFLDEKSNHQDRDFSEFAREIFQMVSENKLSPDSIQDLQRKKIDVDIRYKEIMIKIKEKELSFMKTFDAPPSPRAERAIRSGEMQAIDTISLYDEKNERIQCPDCGILFSWNSFEERKQKKNQFVDHFLQKHGMLTSQQQNELIEL